MRSLAADAIELCSILLQNLDVSDIDFLFVTYLQDKLNKSIEDFEKTTKNSLIDTYEEIYEKTGSDTQIIIAGYPTLFDEKYIGNLIISRNQGRVIHDAVSILDRKFETMVNEINIDNNCSNFHYVSVVDGFEGNNAYSMNSYIFGIKLKSDSLDDLTSSPPSDQSMHPNKKGGKSICFLCAGRNQPH